ncbi:MAG: septal ring lytic transglycosylase RlpA family protein [Rhodospirillales bacterium]
MPSIVRVTNLENGRSIKLKVNDRGPFARERIIDVSRRASQLLGFHQQGTTPVRVEIVEDESRMLAAALGVPSEVAWAAAYQAPTVVATVTPAAVASPAEAPARLSRPPLWKRRRQWSHPPMPRRRLSLRTRLLRALRATRRCPKLYRPPTL